MDDTARHLLDLVVRGQTYEAALELASLFIDVGERSRYTRRDLARHLVVLCSTRHGSFNWATDTFDMVEEWREAMGQPTRPVPTETTVRRHLRSFTVTRPDGSEVYSPALVEDLVNGVLRRLFAIGVARGELRDGYDLVIDETAWPYYGQGRSGYSRRPRLRAGRVVTPGRERTEASVAAVAMPPDKFHATVKGFPFQVLAARFASKRTVPLAYIRRRVGAAEGNEAVLTALLKATVDLPAPGWILMDKGYASTDTVRLLLDAIRDNGWERTRFLVPVIKRTGDVARTVPKNQRVSERWNAKPRVKPRQKSVGVRSLADVAVANYPRATLVTRGPEGERFTLLRDWQTRGDDARARSNVLFYYRPRMVDGEWVMEWQEGYSWIGFYTNAEPTAETAYAITRAYSRRWGIEILNKRDHGFMGLSKAQKMAPRDITYGLGLLLSALENAERTHVLMVRRAKGQATRRGRRRVVRTHEVLGNLDRQARGLGPA